MLINAYYKILIMKIMKIIVSIFNFWSEGWVLANGLKIDASTDPCKPCTRDSLFVWLDNKQASSINNLHAHSMLVGL